MKLGRYTEDGSVLDHPEMVVVVGQQECDHKAALNRKDDVLTCEVCGKTDFLKFEKEYVRFHEFGKVLTEHEIMPWFEQFEQFKLGFDMGFDAAWDAQRKGITRIAELIGEVIEEGGI